MIYDDEINAQIYRSGINTQIYRGEIKQEATGYVKQSYRFLYTDRFLSKANVGGTTPIPPGRFLNPSVFIRAYTNVTSRDTNRGMDEHQPILVSRETQHFATDVFYFPPFGSLFF